MADSEHCRLHEQLYEQGKKLATVEAELKATAMALVLARRETLWMIGAALSFGALIFAVVERIFR